jgi:tripartite-type tricarboxylate transporter receptor subunit TctC
VRYTREPTRRQILKASVGAVPLLMGAGTVVAQAEWPTRPVKVIVPYPAGGGADTVSRILFAKLSEALGQQFVIDNRGGAGGTIGAAVAAKAERDGYTIMYDATAFSVNPSLYPRLPYDTVKDFEPVFLASLVPNLLVVHPSVAAKTVNDVIEIAKAAPGGLDWASSGNGTVQHLSLEMFRMRTGVKLNHIPYRGGGPALNDLIGGQVKSRTAPPRSATCRAAPSRRSPIPAAAGSAPCPTCRRWPKRWPASRPTSGTACSCRLARRPRSCASSMPA